LLFDVAAPADFAARLPSVLRALYLLFSEGYHGASPEAVIRTELCREAMRLIAVVIAHPSGATPAAHALAALMCFNAARLPSRTDGNGALQDFTRQDRSKWDQALIAQGTALLERSAAGDELKAYHLEASIAAAHSRAADVEHTDWQQIVFLYDQLMRIQPSPVVALNRAIAVAHAEGPERGLAEIRAIPDASRLARYPFYEAALGEFELRLGQHAAAHAHFTAALALARNLAEREFLHARLRACSSRLGELLSGGVVSERS
jgi:RNA polymerase sigma-70 factor (ECF subfamily)